MRMEIGFSSRQELSQRVEMSMDQRLEARYTLRLALIESIHGRRYKPQAKCPKCSRKLTLLEILKGFSADPTDYDTTCTGCGTRFQAQLIHHSPAGNIEMPFLCDEQSQWQLRGLEHLSPEEIMKKEPPAYHSALAHNGSLKRTFAKMGIEYGFTELADAKRKITPFLGKLPDTVIAEVSGLSVGVVRSLRKKLNIERYSKSELQAA